MERCERRHLWCVRSGYRLLPSYRNTKKNIKQGLAGYVAITPNLKANAIFILLAEWLEREFRKENHYPVSPRFGNLLKLVNLGVYRVKFATVQPDAFAFRAVFEDNLGI